MDFNFINNLCFYFIFSNLFTRHFFISQEKSSLSLIFLLIVIGAIILGSYTLLIFSNKDDRNQIINLVSLLNK